jgi:translation initiation factor 1A
MEYRSKPTEGPVRVRMPRGRELLGVVEELLGASRFRVKCRDGKTRMCRIPGRFRKRVDVKIGFAVIVEPWEIEPEKGDIIWIYNKTQANFLRGKGYI